MDIVTKTHQAKREERLKARDEIGKTEPIQTTNADNAA